MKTAQPIPAPVPHGYGYRADGLPTHKWVKHRGTYKWVITPTQAQLSRMMADYSSRTPCGLKVEMDHPDGWLVILGIV